MQIICSARRRRENASLSSGGVLAQIGPPDEFMETDIRGQLTTSSLDSGAFDKASDFVFAYCLNMVRYREIVTHRPYTGGDPALADISQTPKGNAIGFVDFEGFKMFNIQFFRGFGEFQQVDVLDHDEIECFVVTLNRER